MTRDDQIRHGEAVASFLGNETIREVFAGLDQVYFRAWKEAPTAAEREQIHAKASALDDLSLSLAAVVASGQRAMHDIEQEQRATASL